MMSPARSRVVIGLAVLSGALGWAYWPTFTAMADKWSTDAQYSHGFLVPVFAAYLLWHRRNVAPSLQTPPSRWGLVFIAIGIALHLAGAYLYFDALGMVSLLPLLAGICLCWGGWRSLRWAWPAIGFLVFMLPLPFSVERALSHPLQRLATYCSNYALQTFGFAAVAEGNVIILDNNARIGVVEACNGLGMLVTFVAMTTATVLVVRRSLLEKLLILPSAIPIAVVCNVIRITVTGMLHTLVGGEFADMVFHDLAGLLMMPLALGLLWLEIRLLGLLLLDPEPEGTPTLGLGLPTLAPSNTRATAVAKV